MRVFPAVALLFLAVAAAPAGAADPQVRVAIYQDAENARLTVPAACRLLDLQTGKQLAAWKDLKWQLVVPSSSGIRIGAVEISSQAVLLRPAAGIVFHVNARPYRGELILRRTGSGRLLVINKLPLEDYLVGALTSEVSAGWPLESLKAHAVVSRTMTAHRIWIRKAHQFDMTADTATHVYHGVAAERSRTRQAVRDTQGQVLAYDRELFSASFHANCGGHTENVAELWSVKKPLPPLAGVEDPFCKDLKHYRWKAAIPERQFLEFLGPDGTGLGEQLKEVSVHEVNRSGRVRSVRIAGEKGAVTLTGRQLRERLGANRLRSLKFAVTLEDGKAAFEGYGWGHGVGLCQWGSFSMSKQNKKMDEILNFYFPGAQRRALKGLPGYS